MNSKCCCARQSHWCFCFGIGFFLSSAECCMHVPGPGSALPGFLLLLTLPDQKWIPNSGSMPGAIAPQPATDYGLLIPPIKITIDPSKLLSVAQYKISAWALEGINPVILQFLQQGMVVFVSAIKVFSVWKSKLEIKTNKQINKQPTQQNTPVKCLSLCTRYCFSA